MEKRINWHIEVKKLSELKPHPKNPRIITSDKKNELGKSFDDIGMAQPININLDGTILSGHARYYQLVDEHIDEVDCYMPDRMLTPKQEEAVIIRMNKNIVGQWDFDKLANDFDLDNLIDWGFTETELGMVNILDPVNTNEEIDTDNFGNDLEHTCPKCGFEFNG